MGRIICSIVIDFLFVSTLGVYTSKAANHNRDEHYRYQFRQARFGKYHPVSDCGDFLYGATCHGKTRQRIHLHVKYCMVYS